MSNFRFPFFATSDVKTMEVKKATEGKQISNFQFLNIGYLITIAALFLYSFTQIDLNLTLSRFDFWQVIEQQLKLIGYFNRPLSTAIFLIILLLLFFFYLSFLKLSLANKINKKQAWFLIIVSAVVLAFSYSAFSYDLFNYIFDAKIITRYHQNPYMQKALDYPSDPMLNFMRWTHRTYPYGPGWLVLTVPLSFIGLNIFLLTFYLFKFLAVGFFLGTAYFISKTLEKISPKNELFGLTFFALNPIVIIESLVSGHNDISMMFFAILGIYLVISKRWFWGFLSILFSVLIKEVTVLLLLPVFLFFISTYSKKIKLSKSKFFSFCVTIMILGFLYVLTKMEVQPWYFLWILPFISLIKPNKYVISLITGISLGLLLRYAPFLYQGDWNGIVIPIKFYVTIMTPILFVAVTFIYSNLAKDLRFKI